MTLKRALIGLAALALPLAAAGALAAQTAQRTYVVGSAACDGWPRAPIDMAPGLCAGVVTGPIAGQFAQRTLKMPRTLLSLAGGKDWIVVDMGGWGNGQGSVWKLTAERGKPAKLTRLLSGLTMPHGLARGPDGRVYVGEMSRIFRFDPAAANPSATLQPVVTGLPDNKLHQHRHPLSNFIFDANNDLLVNVGAPSDQCATKAGKPNGTKRCLESEGGEPTAGVRRYAYQGDGRWSADFTMFARGLRNSLALARNTGGAVVQAENSIDYPEPGRPFEELNVLVDGAHYGWPYCYDEGTPAPVWSGTPGVNCISAAFRKPATLLPPHSAPLGMLYYDGPMFPELKGRLLISLHGYREAGARVVAFDVDASGVPVRKAGARYPVYAAGGAIAQRPYPGAQAESRVLTVGWNLKPGVRPMGAPVGLAVAEDGAIWVAEDKNGTVLRIARDRR